MTYKVTGPNSIFIYQDTAQNRQKYDDLYEYTFYLEHADLTEMIQVLTQHTQGGTGVRPVIQPLKGANAISVKATAPVMQMMEQLDPRQRQAARRRDDRGRDPRGRSQPDAQPRRGSQQLGARLHAVARVLARHRTGSDSADPAAADQPGDADRRRQPRRHLHDGADRRDQFPRDRTRRRSCWRSRRFSAARARRSRSISANEVPVPQTTFGTAAPGQLGTTPTTSFDLRSVGVNLQFTPRVTYDGEIILQDLIGREERDRGASMDVAGQSLPTFRRAERRRRCGCVTASRACSPGCCRDDEFTTNKGFPGTDRHSDPAQHLRRHEQASATRRTS